uniref:Protein kinase domain-containing protein n=1 Tax=Lactuca sativa TaxID=4236 RepID=A0A9R1XQZ7_LACSA|nr:hypothetical protein LSAT_V11C300149420 [Lactuca sativa]
MAQSPDGCTVAFVAGDETLRFWNGKGDGLAIQRSGLQDNWVDAKGYHFGEVLDSRYEVLAVHGKGVFSTVVRAKDLKAGSTDPEEVAIKIIRKNDTMYKAGLEELVILKKLVGANMEIGATMCGLFLNHLCLVFKSLYMNLREVLKKFGRNIGLKLTVVRAYAKQLFIALKHLRNCGVLHTDIKPDNMLVTLSYLIHKVNMLTSYEEIQMMHIPPPHVSCVVEYQLQLSHYEHYLSTKFPFGSYTQVFIDPEMVVSSLSLGASMSIFSSQILYEEKIIDQTIDTRIKLAYGLARQWFEWLLDGLAGLSTKHGHLCFYGNCVVSKADDSSATILSSSDASKALYEIMRLLLFYLMDLMS